MASSKLKTTKDGCKFYDIRVYRGKGLPYYTKRWYVPEGWSAKTIERQLRKEELAFETDCREGKYKNREEKKQILEEQKLQEQKLETVRTFGERVFMSEKGIKNAERTREYYQQKLDKYVYPAIGECKLAEVKPVQLTEILLKMQEKGLDISTVLGVYHAMVMLFKKAFLDDLITISPMLKVERPKPLKKELIVDEIPAFTPEEIQKILECLKNEDLKWRTYFTLMIYTGCREGEVCGLRWKSVDFKGSTVCIENNVCYTKDKGVYNDTPKARNVRTISIPKFVTDLLAEYKADQEAQVRQRTARLEKEKKNPDEEKVVPSEYVFTQKGYNYPMHPQSPTKFFHKFGEKYGIEDCHPHKLRHTYATIAITNNADIASVARILGHADSTTTLRMYTHANRESMKIASNIFEEAIKK